MTNTAKIIALTQPIDETLTAEDFIAYCARVSNLSNQMNTQTAPKLLNYCLSHKHFSIFEMVNVVMEIQTTRDIARQILRHDNKFQEFSQRYADPTQSLGFVIREARLQDTKNRQNSIEVDDKMLLKQWQAYQRQVQYVCEDAYNWAIKNGIAKELARAVLPEGLTLTRLYMQGTLRNYIHWCQLRMGEETQKEHRLIAQSAWEELQKHFKFLRK
jgi:thymidylate synthase (FAD)